MLYDAERSNNGPHSLISSEPGGANRFQPGRHVCDCGAEFTGINAWEKHRAEERKKMVFVPRLCACCGKVH